MNSSYHQLLGESPFFALYGRNKRLPFDSLFQSAKPVYNAENVPRIAMEQHKKVMNFIGNNHKMSQEAYISKSETRTKKRDVKPGDRIFFISGSPS